MSEIAPPILKQPVLVLGATSLIGRFVLPRLKSAGLDHVPLSRTADLPDGVRADLADPDLGSRLPDCPTVLSLSPIWHLPQALPALKAKGVTRLVAFSSTSVTGKAASPDPAEQAVVKRLADGEAQVRAFCQTNGVAWTVLRPTLIYAEGQDQNVTRLARMIRKLGVLPLYGTGQGRRQPVHADDLAAAAIAAAASPQAENRTFDLAGGETLTYRAMAERVFEGLDRKPAIVAAPEWLWNIAFTLAKPLLPGATSQMGARMAEDLVFDNAPAAAAFGWAPRAFHPDFRKL